MQLPVKSNYQEILPSLPGNSLATIGNPLAPIGKSTIEAKEFSDRG